MLILALLILAILILITYWTTHAVLVTYALCNMHNGLVISYSKYGRVSFASIYGRECTKENSQSLECEIPWQSHDASPAWPTTLVLSVSSQVKCLCEIGNHSEHN